jgi:hypothetical protein
VSKFVEVIDAVDVGAEEFFLLSSDDLGTVASWFIGGLAHAGEGVIDLLIAEVFEVGLIFDHAIEVVWIFACDIEDE